MEWENMFANITYDKGLISKIYKEVLKFNSKKANEQLKMGKKLEKIFLQVMQMAKKHMKRCSTSLVIREKQVKTARYHFTPIKMANIEKKERKRK